MLVHVFQLFKGITFEANSLLNDLQESLHSQESKLTAYAQQQREAHSRAIQTTRTISQITVNFFKTLDGHASKIGQIVEEAQTIDDQKLSELEKKFEKLSMRQIYRITTMYWKCFVFVLENGVITPYVP
ncbi:hypothetical protein ACS0TY_025328 [Phlomoides rotata]